MNRLYKEVDLGLDQNDIKFLEYIRDTYRNKSKPFQGKNLDGSLRPVFNNYKNFYLKDSPTDYSDHPIFVKISKLCNRLPNHSRVEYVYSRSHLAYVPGKLPYHIDARECVLTIPIGKIEYPISWVDDSEESIIGSYQYVSPVLVNTKIKHGCLNNDRDRFMFQVGFGEPFMHVASLI